MKFILVFLGWLAAFSTLNIMLRQWMDGLAPTTLTFTAAASLLWSPVPWLAGLLYVACAGLYALAMGSAPLSIVGPVFLTAGVVVTALLGWAMFNETITTLKASGLAVIIVGIGILFLAEAARRG